ncbi:MAG: hypothetical protein ACYC6Y_16045 [Thermoguttaceae bacterium]
MSQSLLAQVHNELRRLACAGSVAAPGDVRLKALVPRLRRAGARSPAMAQVAEAVAHLVDSDEDTSAAALLDLASLVHSALTTHGRDGVEGEWEQPGTIDLGGRLTLPIPASVLRPLLQALAGVGPGRLPILCDALNRGLFDDVRLLGPALAALDDPSAEVADFIANQVLPVYGAAILPPLRAGFDPKGRAGHARRLLLMHRLDPAGSRALVQRALHAGSRDVKA